MTIRMFPEQATRLDEPKHTPRLRVVEVLLTDGARTILHHLFQHLFHLLSFVHVLVHVLEIDRKTSLCSHFFRDTRLPHLDNFMMYTVTLQWARRLNTIDFHIHVRAQVAKQG